MPNTRDIPASMREFNKLFNSIAMRHDYSIVFNDFLDFTLKGFSPWDDFNELNEYGQKRYSKPERETFGQLILELIRVMNIEIVTDTDWCDPLGTYYEVLASQGKKASLGQFFTPESLCDLIVQINGDANCKGKLINDPCSGSGRFIISFHAHHPQNYYFAEDVDSTCCKMTALNMCMHGAVGVVINYNSLSRDDFRGAWVVNDLLFREGIPTIRKIKQAEVNMFYNIWKPLQENVYRRAETQPTFETTKPLQPEIRLEQVEQLTLF